MTPGLKTDTKKLKLDDLKFFSPKGNSLTQSSANMIAPLVVGGGTMDAKNTNSSDEVGAAINSQKILTDGVVSY